MVSLADLPQTIALFPLTGALLLPRAHLPLHIFEPRYLAMLDDCLKTSHRMIGMIQPVAVPQGCAQKLHTIGCAGRVTAFSETQDGRYMITLTGVSRFKVSAQIPSFSPYIRSDVCWEPFCRDLGPSEQDAQFDRAGFLCLLARYFDQQDLSADWDSLKDADEEMLINSLSMMCPFEPEDKQALLEAPSLETRRETLVTLIEFFLRDHGKQERLQ